MQKKSRDEINTDNSDLKLKEQINDCYLRILKRPADPSGLNHYMNKIKNGYLTLDKLSEKLIKSHEFKEHQKMLEIQNPSLKIKKPIFIIGVPRTGTTFIYRILCFHPDLAYMSHLDLKNWIPEDEQKKFKNHFNKMKENNEPIPRNEPALFVFGTDLVPGVVDKSRTPIEGETLWKKHLPSYKKNISEDTKNVVIKAVTDVIESQKKPRFLNKAPQNSARLFAIQKCFPDAKFINMARDPLAVISSFIGRIEREGVFDTGIPIQNISEYKKLDPIQQFAWRYKEITDAIYDFAKLQNKDTFVTVRYEKMIANPQGILKKILQFCDLEMPPEFEKRIPRIHKNQTTKWKQKLSSDDVRKIFDIVTPSLEKMNYPYRLEDFN